MIAVVALSLPCNCFFGLAHVISVVVIVVVVAAVVVVVAVDEDDGDDMLVTVLEHNL